LGIREKAEMKDVLNARIKRREPFRPFAPSILEEKVEEYVTESYPDPFMIKVYPVRPDKQSVIPAVTHVDGSGRLQTVSKTQNPRYWGLIKGVSAWKSNDHYFQHAGGRALGILSKLQGTPEACKRVAGGRARSATPPEPGAYRPVGTPEGCKNIANDPSRTLRRTNCPWHAAGVLQTR
jgi:Carbamoyltransferase C-terminus